MAMPQHLMRELVSGWASAPAQLARCIDAAHSRLGTLLLRQGPAAAWPAACISSTATSTTAGATAAQQAGAALKRASTTFLADGCPSTLHQCRHMLNSALSQCGGSTALGPTQLQQRQRVWHMLQQQASHCNASPWSTAKCRSFASRTQRKQQASSSDMALYAGAVAIAFIGFAYAMVPIYRIFCAATGYGGTLATADTVEEKLRKRLANPNPEVEKAAAQRELRVWFNADVADNMPWQFKPAQDCVQIKAGQSALAFFTAHNKSDKPVTGYSLYNVQPDRAAQYFNKIQCFCFEEQRLRAGETVDMPVFFYIDPEMATDWNCRNIHDITLSYVFNKVDDADLEEHEEDSDLPTGLRLHGAGIEALPEGIAPPQVPAHAPAGAAAMYQQPPPAAAAAPAQTA